MGRGRLNYTVISGDWPNLEYIISDMSRILSQQLDEEHPLSNYVFTNGSRAFTGNQSMGSHRLTNVLDPIDNQDATTKAYVLSVVSGIIGVLRMNELKQNTATTIMLPRQLFDYGDSKTLLYEALGGNDNFDPTKLICTLTKNATQSVLTLTKSGGDNDMNLVSDGLATFEFTAGNVDTLGKLILSFTNATVGSEVIFPLSFEFFVVA